MFTFRCGACDQTHEGLPDLAFQLPQVIFEIDEEEREARCTISSDLCTLDDEFFFVRGVLQFPIAGSDDVFAYGTWSTLSQKNFEIYSQTFNDQIQSNLGPFFGYLSNPIPGYAESLNLHLDVFPRDQGDRPSFVLHDQGHELFDVQQSGMAREDVIERVQSILHPSSAV